MKHRAKKTLAGLALVLTALAAAAAPPTASFSSLPLYFEAASPASFLARGSDSQFSVSPDGAQVALQKSGATRTVQMQFAGANPQAQIQGGAALPGKINYLTGGDSAQWRLNVPTFARLSVSEIYPGINLVYYGNQRQLEYDFTVAAGANPNSIAIHFSGADKISMNAQGGLVLSLGDSEIVQPKPLIYQTVGGTRKEIAGGYKILDAHAVAFAVGNYDRALPLVIDPVLAYSTYFGGILADTAWAVAVDTSSNVYVAGQTLSKYSIKKVPFSTPGALEQNFAGGKLIGDGFVAKFDRTGTNLIYLTYLGGSGDDFVASVAVNAAGNAFVTGFTDSPNFPTTTNALQHAIGGTLNKRTKAYPGDAFVAELNPAGSGLVYSTFLGGSGLEAGYGIAVDSADNAYVTGITGSTNFPATNALAFQLAGSTNLMLNRLAGTNNAFVAEIGAGGSPLVFSTYFGGNNFDAGESIAVDNTGYIYVAGFTDSTNFPTFNAVFPAIDNGTNLVKKNAVYPFDAFVAKFAPSGANLVYSTCLGGMGDDVAYHIACDTNGCAYVTGYTTSPDFTNTVTNLFALYNIPTNHPVSLLGVKAFLTKFAANGAVAYSTIFGGSQTDYGYGVAVDALGDAFVVGTTPSTDFPTNNMPTNNVAGALRAANSGGSDVFVTAFNPDATALLYSGYLGGKKNDYGYGIAVDPAGNAYIVGQTASTDFPATNAFQTFRNGASDTFLTKILTPLSP
jgi:hypothetical protein